MRFARIFSAVFALLLAAGGASAREMENYPVVKLQSLDKVTARTMTFEANVGNTVKFGSLYIKIQACAKAPPVEQPESAAFLQIWEMRKGHEEDTDSASVTEQPPKEEAQWIFSGWMFASSPALSHMDHPIYDVWVLDCLSEKGGGKKAVKKEESGAEEAETKKEEQPQETEAAAESAAEGAIENPADTPVESEELSPLGD